MRDLGVVVAVADGRIPIEAPPRLLGLDDDRTGHAVQTVDCALRTLENFDLGEVRQLPVQVERVDLQHPVDHQGVIRLGISAGIDAAGPQLEIADLRGLNRGNAGGEGDEVRGPLDAGGADVVDREDGERCRR